MSSPRVFFAYRDAPERRFALREPEGALERYRLFGLDQLAARGVAVDHNLKASSTPAWARVADRGINAAVYRLGGYGGDFASVLASVRQANAADVVFSTVDTVGIPLVLLKRAGFVRPPLVYVSVGLPERVAQLRGERMKHSFRRAFESVQTVIAYAKAEADMIRDWIGPGRARVEFVPFGVDIHGFRPVPDAVLDVDVVSIGADPRRDFDLLLAIARRRPELSVRIVAARERARTLRDVPANVVVETDLELSEVHDRLAAARVVALPVRENSYSGATTTLLQAMAMAKPVVVSRTEAIARGYHLEDGVNCRLVPPGDASTFERALLELPPDDERAAAVGARARETVERHLTWEHYVDRIWELLRGG